MTTTDRIEKKILLRAPRSRVWRALTNAEEFGAWFRVKLQGDFTVGKRIQGKITYPGYEHLTMDVTVQRMDEGQLFSFRWHPYAIDPKIDYSTEPTTLVEFRLEEAADGTLLTVVESGFDRIPPARRAEAFPRNEEGWTVQLKNIENYVSQAQQR
jgi:uncharacterized protein YndB with AHSA1/START domain